MSANLNITNLASSQIDKETTINDAIGALDAAITEVLSSDFAAGNIVLTDAQFRSNLTHKLTNVSASRDFTVPGIKHVFLVIGDSANTNVVTVKRGTTSVSVSANDVKLLYADGTANGLFVISGGAGGAGVSTQYFSIVSFDYTVDTAVGDGAGYFHIPPGVDGMNLTYVHAEVITAGVTGTTDIQIANVTGAVDILSTKLTIGTAETGSDTAAAPAVINLSNDNVATNDLIRIDIDAVSTTAAKGLIVTLGFDAP